jgi:hypothetical protein
MLKWMRQASLVSPFSWTMLASSTPFRFVSVSQTAWTASAGLSLGCSVIQFFAVVVMNTRMPATLPSTRVFMTVTACRQFSRSLGFTCARFHRRQGSDAMEAGAARPNARLCVMPDLGYGPAITKRPRDVGASGAMAAGGKS